jgi:hypothetical protein
MAKYKNDHLRKARHSIAEWTKYIANLDRTDRAREKLYRERLATYRELVKDTATDRIYYLASFSAPNRHCLAWQKRIQQLTGYRLASYINSLIAATYLLKATAYKARRGRVEGS